MEALAQTWPYVLTVVFAAGGLFMQVRSGFTRNDLEHKRLNDKLDRVNGRLLDHETRVSHLEGEG